MTKPDFLRTVREQGFVLHEMPDGLRDAAHTQLFRHEESQPDIYVEAYHNGDPWKNYPSSEFYIKLIIGGLDIYKKVDEVSSLVEFEAWFMEWTKPRDGHLSEEEQRRSMASLMSFVEHIREKRGY